MAVGLGRRRGGRRLPPGEEVRIWPPRRSSVAVDGEEPEIRLLLSSSWWLWVVGRVAGLCWLSASTAVEVAGVPIVGDLREHVLLLLGDRRLLPSHQQRTVSEGEPPQFAGLA